VFFDISYTLCDAVVGLFISEAVGMSRFKRYFGLWFKDEAKLDRWLRLYIHHKNLFNKGRGEVAFVFSLFNPGSLMIGWLFFRDLVPELPYWVLFIMVPVWMFFEIGLSWSVGLWWDKNKVYDKEADWGNDRNPISKAVSERLLNGEGITK